MTPDATRQAAALEAFDAADQRVIEAELGDGPGWCLDLADALDRRDEAQHAR